MDNYQDEIIKKAHDNDMLLSLMIELTTICNEKCEHCYIPEHTNWGLDTGFLKKVISEFRNLGGLNLSLTGGEIFLRNDLLELIEHARKCRLRVFLLTNATLITKEIARKLKELYVAELSISIYSLDEKVHDSITGVEGTLAKTLEAIEYLKEEGIHITIKTPLMEKNKYAYKELQKFCENNNCGYLASTIIFSKSNKDQSVKDLSINEFEMPIIAKEVESIEPARKRDMFPEACGSLKYSLAIDSYGIVHPCNSFYYQVGNIKEEPLRDIWNSEKLREIKNIKKSELTDCVSCKLKKACRRCPGLAYLEDGDYMCCSSTARANAYMRLYD